MKIFINTPFSSDANSFWRCIGPMSYLAKHSEGDIDLFHPKDGDQIFWDRLIEFDIVFMHRPCRPKDVILMKMARMLNIPVWSDYDDWLFCLPEWNPNLPQYHQSEVQTAIAACIACSDIVTVSTDALQKKFSYLNDNVVILPNAYRSDLFDFKAQNIERPKKKDIFFWRGSNTHDGDLLSVLDGLKSLSKPLHLMGVPSYSVMSQLDTEKVVKLEVADPIGYWRHIYQIAPKVWLFPLKDRFFNECKSNISWIEATHAGAVCVAPNLPEWRRPGVLLYDIGDSNSFLTAAECAMALDETDHAALVALSKKEIETKYDITVVNYIREELAYALTDNEFKRNTRDVFSPLIGAWSLDVMKKKNEQS